MFCFICLTSRDKIHCLIDYRPASYYLTCYSQIVKPVSYLFNLRSFTFNSGCNSNINLRFQNKKRPPFVTSILTGITAVESTKSNTLLGFQQREPPILRSSSKSSSYVWEEQVCTVRDSRLGT